MSNGKHGAGVGVGLGDTTPATPATSTLISGRFEAAEEDPICHLPKPQTPSVSAKIEACEMVFHAFAARSRLNNAIWLPLYFESLWVTFPAACGVSPVD